MDTRKAQLKDSNGLPNTLGHYAGTDGAAQGNPKAELLLEGLGIRFPTHHQRKIVERAILGLPLHRPFASESTEGALKANSVASRALFRHRLIMQKQIF